MCPHGFDRGKLTEIEICRLLLPCCFTWVRNLMFRNILTREGTIMTLILEVILSNTYLEIDYLEGYLCFSHLRPANAGKVYYYCSLQRYF